jgi:hypothetical protein
VERLLAVRCPNLLVEAEDGRAAKAFTAVTTVMDTFSPAIDVIRPGVAALVVRGPSRYFGGDAALARRVLDAVHGVTGTEETGRRADLAGVGVADGLFAAILAAGAGGENPLIVAPGETAGFLAPWSVAVLDRAELAELLVRLGIDTLGRFAALPARHVLARFGADGAVCHRVARGVVGDLPGLRLPSLVTTHHVRTDPVTRQPGFWGGAAAADTRAAEAFARVEEILGPGTVVLGRIQGGRSPAERARLVPWASVAAARTGRRESGTGTRSGPVPPWPGQLPPPAPTVVFTPPRPVQLEDATGRRVAVDGRGTPSAEPARLSIDGGPWEAVERFAGPWPADERWWATRRRRRARMQVVTGGGAHLLAVERSRWWLEGSYD